MEKFLKIVAADIHGKFKNDIGDLTIVFPNRRAGVFFYKHLSEIINNSTWAPNVTTINDLMKQQSSIKVVDKLLLTIILFDIYKKHTKSNESFDDFYFWGEMLINDFDDIDKYMVDTSDLLKNLSFIKEIDISFDSITPEQMAVLKHFLGNLRESKDSNQKKKFLNFWKALYPIYNDFKQVLIEKNIAYEGMVYRQVADLILKDQSFNVGALKYIFVGFNALNKCEKVLFKYLQQEKKALFYWDYDLFYIENKRHEAGFFMRENIVQFTGEQIDKLNVFQNSINIEFVNIASDVGQAKVVTSVLENLKDDENKNDTAVVLSDENLLIPVIDSIPDAYSGINVTMGYPIKFSPIIKLFEYYYELVKNAKSIDSNFCYYYKDVVNILSHYYVYKTIQVDLHEIINKISKENLIYIPAAFLTDKSKLLASIFKIPSDDNESLFVQCNLICSTLLDALTTNLESSATEKFIREVLFTSFTILNKFSDALKEYDYKLSSKTEIKLLKQVLSNSSVSFVGEPIADLQIMGVLESRSLDFSNLIVLSMNEGIMPATSSAGSFIPYNLRKAFGLQTIEHQNSIFSYYFYRLLHRAKKVWLVYNSSSTGLTTGEMSRFMMQLKYQSSVNIKESTVTYSVLLPEKRYISVPNSEFVQDKMRCYYDTKSSKSLSATALNTYLECSLKFYYKYILSISDPEQITESIDALVFGIILHEVMQVLYTDFVGNEVTAEKLNSLLNNESLIEKQIETSYLKQLKLSDNQFIHSSGENEIIIKVLTKYITNIILFDIKRSPFLFQEPEQKFLVTIPVAVNDTEKNIRLGGTIDRVDNDEKATYIIDYKTSAVKNEFQEISSLFKTNNFDRNKLIFQILFYSYSYQLQNNNSIVPVLYAAREINQWNDIKFIIQKIKRKPYPIYSFEQVKEDFEMELKSLLTEMFSKSTSFSQTKDEKSCQYCSYKQLCHRY